MCKSTRVREDCINSDFSNPLKMAKIACYKLQSMVYGGGGDLNICIRKDCSCFFEISADLAKNLCAPKVIRQNSYRREKVDDKDEKAIPI
jgi:hypothetical protein